MSITFTGCAGKHRKEPEAARLAKLWGRLVKPFGCLAAYAHTEKEIRSLLAGDTERHIRGYTAGEIETTIKAMAKALALARQNEDFEFEVYSDRYLGFCCQRVIREHKKLGEWRRTLRLPVVRTRS